MKNMYKWQSLPVGFSSLVNSVIGEPETTSSKTTKIKAAMSPRENVTAPDINLTLHSPTVSAIKVILKIHRVLMIDWLNHL